jgi:tRNA A-37 threonylcarbamoyl transferase component Bud32
MRQEALDQSKLLACGRTAEVYAWSEGRVLKLFFAWCPAAWAQYEARVTRGARAAGLPVPEVDDMIEVDGRFGIIFERIEGHSIVAEGKQRPWRMLQLSALMGELQVAMHNCEIPALPSLHDQLRRRIDGLPPDILSPELKEGVLNLLSRLSDGAALCHGDFHPENVLITPHGPVILDWMTAAQGNTLADVARTALILQLRSGSPGKQVTRSVDLLRPLIRGAYLRRYFQLRPGSRSRLAAWMIPVAAARLEERIPGEREQILSLLESRLGPYLHRS